MKSQTVLLSYKYLNKYFYPDCDICVCVCIYIYLMNIGTAQWDVQIKSKLKQCVIA